jgi:hypothetical protein
MKNDFRPKKNSAETVFLSVAGVFGELLELRGTIGGSLIAALDK